MAASSRTFALPIPTKARIATPGRAEKRRRRVSREAGRALEILGHAIEYLADELIYAGESLSAHDGRWEAVQLLMRLNREIYFACPVVPSFSERLRRWLKAWTA